MLPTAEVRVADHLFGVFDQHQQRLPVETADWSTGLVVPMSMGALVYTGIDRGAVRVSAQVRTQAPDDIDAGPWDDIVEASVHSTHGMLAIHSLEYAPGEHPPALPPLSSRGPGGYRLRAHARGRDLHYDAVQNEPTEDYLLVIWPAAPAPPLIIRATDQCGYGLRLNHMQRLQMAPPPETAPADTVQQRRQRLIDAQLSAAARAAEQGPTPSP